MKFTIDWNAIHKDGIYEPILDSENSAVNSDHVDEISLPVIDLDTGAKHIACFMLSGVE